MGQNNAANNLLGLTLDSGWKVIEKIEKSVYSTGAFFSVCYKVKKGDEICFLKAFDFAKFFQLAEPGKRIVDVMTDMLNAYKYEKQLSDYCKAHYVTKVIFVKYAGEEIVTGYPISVVPYLIFDLADGDVRKNLHFSEGLDFSWRLKSLHDIAVGLKQLHYIDISHQDLKPSNILLVNGESRIGDLGRSICKAMNSPYDGMNFSGDYSYAPPEIMYGYYIKDWRNRVFSTDCFLLGSMVVFYFSGVTMSALLNKYIPADFGWEIWRGGYEEVTPHVMHAFSTALTEFGDNISDDYFKTELKWMVEKLCYPIPEKRGHPKSIVSKINSYNLERFVSKFDLLHKTSIYRLKKNG